LRDHLNSVVQTTNASATVTLTRDYDPFGNPLAGSANGGYAFTGRDWDAEINLYYYRARYYDPSVGRFLSEDPIGLQGGPNLYTYVLNNPGRYRDPSGTSVGVWVAIIVAGVIIWILIESPSCSNKPAGEPPPTPGPPPSTVHTQTQELIDQCNGGGGMAVDPWNPACRELCHRTGNKYAGCI
jgi:RHS repeat-associated protein